MRLHASISEYLRVSPSISECQRQIPTERLTLCVHACAAQVLSYPWLDANHPDGLGEHLRRLQPILTAMLSGCASEHATVGVMIDFCSLPQRPRVSEAEEATFKRALKGINAWYTHALMPHSHPMPRLMPSSPYFPWCHVARPHAS